MNFKINIYRVLMKISSARKCKVAYFYYNHLLNTKFYRIIIDHYYIVKSVLSNFVNQYFNNSKPCTWIVIWCIGFLTFLTFFTFLTFQHFLTSWDIFSYIQKDLQNTIYFFSQNRSNYLNYYNQWKYLLKAELARSFWQNLERYYCTN